MIKWLKRLFAALIAIFLALTFLWLTVAHWLPWVIKQWLPAGTRVEFSARPYWSNGALHLPGLSYVAEDCRLGDLSAARLRYQQGRWQMLADTLDVNTQCLEKLPSSDTPSAPLELDKIQRSLPLFDVAINHLIVSPWQDYAGAISVVNNADGQTVRYRSDRLSLDARLDDKQKLTVKKLSLKVPQTEQPIELDGELQIPLDLASLPRSGNMQAQLKTPFVDQPLLLISEWKNKQGNLKIVAKGDKTPLADLPWTVSRHEIHVNKGQWRWPYAQQPLQGGIDLTLTNWDKNYQQTQIEARMNVLTQGNHGKGNVVVNLGPGKLSVIDSSMAFRVTGLVNSQNLSLTASIPGLLTGSVLNPLLTLDSGSLLRAWGRLDDQTTLQEARWPLAGIKLNADGVTGRLQAIMKVKDSYWGNFKLHLDGQAQQFMPDKGQWQWQYWGNGDLPPLAAKWDVGGRGEWLGNTIRLNQLSTGFDKIHYGMMTVVKPRLTIDQPIVWIRDEKQPKFTGAFMLDTNKVELENGGYLPHAILNLAATGTAPDQFLLKGDLHAERIGPIKLNGRWDGERLRGEAWWAKQPTAVFQPLLSPDLNITLRDGDFYAQAAFSAAREQGFEAGGHMVVKNAGMWLKDGEMSGLDFIMAYRLKNEIWQLGAKQPISLRIKHLSNLFEMSNISADLQGYYPYSDRAPLVLSNVGVDMLKGHIGFDALRLPQPASTVLRLKDIDLSVLFTALKPKQFAMSGRVDGELPLYLKDAQWLIRNGWIDNASMLTLRLDPDMADAMAANNMAAGAAIEWLRYMEISRSRAEVNLSNLGVLTMAATIRGVNPQQSAHREVVLNYHHEENIFELWRSLRFGDNLQEWLEQSLSTPARSEHEQP